MDRNYNKIDQHICDFSQFYNIIIYNDFCESKDSIYIKVNNVFCDKNKIIIPNAFSPNNDNINDSYRIIDTEGIVTMFNLEIFNRFGEKVYSSNNIYDVWDGSFKNQELSTQVFDYYLEIKCVGGENLF